jgi:carbon monoxide dehydrogenase subunit G
MDIRVDVELPCSIDAVLPLINDLTQYPQWMGLVHVVVPEADHQAWQVELRGKIGPFARSKRLRMIQVETQEPHHIRFVRQENDGRSHSDWVLDAQVTEVGSASTLNMTLHYGGRLFSNVVERALHDEIEASKQRLRKLVA